MTDGFLKALKEKILFDGHRIQDDEALRVYRWENLSELKEAAGEIARHFCGTKIEPCGLINARQGKCGEDCKYCAQSRFWNAECETTKMMDAETALKIADGHFKNGVRRVCVITSGRGLGGEDFEKALSIIRAIKEKYKDECAVCASLGILDKERLLALKAAGVSRAANNLETSEQFFPRVCSTHSWREKFRYAQTAKECGLELCSGLILGMGESAQDRIGAALALAKIGADSIPLNRLSPVKGTPLESAPPLSDEDFFRTLAAVRFANPKSRVRLAAGRSAFLDMGRSALLSGANAFVAGGLLTLAGSEQNEDMKMIQELRALNAARRS